MYTIHYTKAAIKAPIKIPADYRERIVGEIESVAASPALYRGDWKRMQGLWRLRVGGYRANCAMAIWSCWWSRWVRGEMSINERAGD